MPRRLQAWYGFPELAALGDRGAELTGSLKLAQLTRLRPLLHGDAGEDDAVAVRLRMGRTGGGRLTMTLRCEVKLELVCQRCLEPLEIALDEQVEWVVVGSPTEGRGGNELEELVLDKGRVRLAALVEDELIVSLPMIPRHASIDECGALARNLKPFLRMQESAPTSTTLEV